MPLALPPRALPLLSPRLLSSAQLDEGDCVTLLVPTIAERDEEFGTQIPAFTVELSETDRPVNPFNQRLLASQDAIVAARTAAAAEAAAKAAAEDAAEAQAQAAKRRKVARAVSGHEPPLQAPAPPGAAVAGRRQSPRCHQSTAADVAAAASAAANAVAASSGVVRSSRSKAVCFPAAAAVASASASGAALPVVPAALAAETTNLPRRSKRHMPEAAQDGSALSVHGMRMARRAAAGILRRGERGATKRVATTSSCLYELSSELLALILSHLSLGEILALRATSAKFLGCTEVAESLEFSKLAFPIPLPHAALVAAAFPSVSTLSFARNSIERSPKPASASASSPQSVMPQSSYAADEGRRGGAALSLTPVPSSSPIASLGLPGARGMSPAATAAPATNVAAAVAAPTAAAAAPAGSDRVTRGSKRRRVNEAADDTQGTAGGNSGEERSDYEPTCSAAALSRMPTEVVAFPSAESRAAAPPEAITTLGCLLAHKLPTLRVLIAHGNDVFADGAEQLARAVRAASQASTTSTPSAAAGDSFADAIGSASAEVAAPPDVAQPASSSSSTAAAAASSSGGLSRDVQTSTTALASSAAVVSGLLLTTLDLSDTKVCTSRPCGALRGGGSPRGQHLSTP